jgi:hypothetical protein
MVQKRRIRLSPKNPKRIRPVPEPRRVLHVGRNEPCPCGSGKKYKECHESAGQAFLKKMAKKRNMERVKEERGRLKAKGEPWYKRLFS